MFAIPLSCRMPGIADQELAVHGWIYSLRNGGLKDLNVCMTGKDQLDDIYRIESELEGDEDAVASESKYTDQDRRATAIEKSAAGFSSCERMARFLSSAFCAGGFSWRPPLPIKWIDGMAVARFQGWSFTSHGTPPVSGFLF
jgi:hypothetical protein